MNDTLNIVTRIWRLHAGVWHDPWRRRTWVAETCVADCYETVQKTSAIEFYSEV